MHDCEKSAMALCIQMLAISLSLTIMSIRFESHFVRILCHFTVAVYKLFIPRDYAFCAVLDMLATVIIKTYTVNVLCFCVSATLITSSVVYIGCFHSIYTNYLTTAFV